MRIKLILGWLYAVGLCFIYCFLLFIYRLPLCLKDSISPFNPIFFALTFAVAIGCCVLISWLCRKRHLDSRGYWRLALLVLLTIPIAVLLRDAPPIENDYSLRDIVPEDQKVLDSYDTLMLLRKNGGITIERTFASSNYPQFQTNLLEKLLTNTLIYSKSISRAWEDIAPARAVIEKLNQYPGITDLTPQVRLGTNTPVLNVWVLRDVSWTYAAYASLKTAEGHPAEGVQPLATLHSVARKALPHSAILIDKMIWIVTTRNNIEAAHAILQQPQCDHETLELLNKAFSPISEQDVSLRRVFIAEYVGQKAFFGTELKPSDFLNNFVWITFGESPRAPSIFRKVVSYLAYHLTFRKNRTFRDLKTLLDLLVEGAGRHPPDLSRAEIFMDDYVRHPVVRNLSGWRIVYCAVPSFKRAIETVVKTKVLSDLLAIELGDRLNQPVVLDDYYSGSPYQRDERTGQPFSVGPDKQPNTSDDIVLGKN